MATTSSSGRLKLAWIGFATCRAEPVRYWSATTRVFGLHGAKDCRSAGADPILVPEGEAAKDWAQLHALLGALAERGASRNTPIIALGGGSVGDLAGLAAALFKRGCPIVHIPTTLLAQADSAIGGKTAIDAFGEKNLVGTFHQPSLVIADPAYLDTLDVAQLRAGYAEVVKYGLIDDPAFFAWCEAMAAASSPAIPTCVRMPSRPQSRPRRGSSPGISKTGRGKRALLNLGHSFGHAIEAEAGLGSDAPRRGRCAWHGAGVPFLGRDWACARLPTRMLSYPRKATVACRRGWPRSAWAARAAGSPAGWPGTRRTSPASLRWCLPAALARHSWNLLSTFAA